MSRRTNSGSAALLPTSSPTPQSEHRLRWDPIGVPVPSAHAVEASAIPADDDHDRDSTFGGDRMSLASSSTSLNSSIMRYQFEHGRRYHGHQHNKYSFPNDEQELERMDIEHHNQLLQLGGRLYMCPMTEDPEEILDLGTGTGIWAIEMADLFPNCQVIGTDLSPTQPSWVPPNCKFEIDDFEQSWTFGSNRFDMIHQRFLVGSVSSFPRLYKRAYHALKPGGWLELSDLEFGVYSDDNSMPPDAVLPRWGEWLTEAFDKLGNPIPRTTDFPALLSEAGFVNINVMPIKRPTNDWPRDPRMKEIGKYCCLNLMEGIEGFTLAPFTRVLGWTTEEVEILVAKIRVELCKRSMHSYMKGIICWAQKPYDAR